MIPNLLNLYKHIDLSGDCWLWTGSTTPKGYGMMTWGWKENKHTMRIHRLVYILTIGDLRPGITVDHKCHNEADCQDGDRCLHRRCVNPRHLEAVTHKENCDRRPKHRKAFCKRGHDLSIHGAEDRRGWGRYCVPCKRERNRTWMRDHQKPVSVRRAKLIARP